MDAAAPDLLAVSIESGEAGAQGCRSSSSPAVAREAGDYGRVTMRAPPPPSPPLFDTSRSSRRERCTRQRLLLRLRIGLWLML